MTAETYGPLLARAQQCEFYTGALAEFGSELPAEDGALDAAIEEAVRRRNELAFPTLVFAALQAGRRVDARHLAEGSALFCEPTLMCGAAWGMSGDVCGSLLKAVRAESLDRLSSLLAMIVAAGWWKTREAGPVPTELIAQARTLARQSRSDPFLQLHAAALSGILQDKSLESILEHIGSLEFANTSDHIVERLNGKLSEAPLSVIPERPPPVEISGFTVRRAVPRIGRNDPCPCGSGKKYKRCCWDRDRERLRHSSEVAGKTREEVREHPEEHLTWDRLRRMKSYELSRIEPTMLAAELRENYIEQLVLHGEHEAVVKFFETVSGEGLEWAWENAVDQMTERGQKEWVTRMLRVAPPGAPKLGLGPELLLASEEERRLLDKIETKARAALACPAHEAPISLAYTLLSSAWPGLGVLLARGAISIAPAFDGMVLMDALLKARDRMNLSVTDPLEAVWEHQMKLRSGLHESEALHEVQDRLDGKIKQVEQLNLRLRTLENQMERQERLAGGRAERSNSERPAAVAEAGGEEARREIKRLKADLKQRHSERNSLRHELQEALREVETLRERMDADSDTLETKEREEREEDALLSQEPEAMGVQPVRVPVFPRKFHERLSSLPQPVGRSALAIIGRLAGGEAAAFVGCKRLRMDMRVFRQRVGLWHRLLFRLEPGVLEVIDLVPRKDLERRIKNL